MRAASRVLHHQHQFLHRLHFRFQCLQGDSFPSCHGALHQGLTYKMYYSREGYKDTENKCFK